MFQLIASYPKSGNTYVRIFLANYLRGETDLNKIGWPIFASRAFFPVGMPSARKQIIFPNNEEVHISKTHEIASLYHQHFCNRAVYIVRNPIDITPSWARHMSCSIDDAIRAMGKDKRLKGTPRIFEQHIGSWSSNVLSWLSQKNFPVYCIRYETLASRPDTAFTSMLNFLGVQVETKRLCDALEFCRFQNLQNLEHEKKFKEARGSTGKFFNVGRAGNGKEVLTPEQIREVKRIHGPVMRLLGYDA